MGRKRAMEMLLTGESIDAPTAAEWGLVNRVVPDDRSRRGCGGAGREHHAIQPVRDRDRQAGLLRAGGPRRAGRLRTTRTVMAANAQLPMPRRAWPRSSTSARPTWSNRWPWCPTKRLHHPTHPALFLERSADVFPERVAVVYGSRRRVVPRLADAGYAPAGRCGIGDHAGRPGRLSDAEPPRDARRPLRRCRWQAPCSSRSTPACRATRSVTSSSIRGPSSWSSTPSCSPAAAPDLVTVPRSRSGRGRRRRHPRSCRGDALRGVLSRRRATGARGGSTTRTA